MKRFLNVIIIFTLCSSEKCEQDEICKNGGHVGVEIVNNSNKVINFIFYWNYPDTIIGNYNPVNDGTQGIKPKASRIQPFSSHGSGCVESYFTVKEKEWIYIFDYDTITQLNWEIVRKTNRGLLERRLIDLEYLQQNDFKIIYP